MWGFVAVWVGWLQSFAAKIAVARDTRPSGPALLDALKAGVGAVDAGLADFGIMTTPQLHFVVRCTNDASYGTPTEDGYNEKLATAFATLFTTFGLTEPIKLKVDCANGVGAPAFAKLAAKLTGKLEVVLCNDGTTGKLNDNCGADYVKTNQAAPPGMYVLA